MKRRGAAAHTHLGGNAKEWMSGTSVQAIGKGIENLWKRHGGMLKEYAVHKRRKEDSNGILK